mgnify:CR=1 FL=1
MLLSYFLKNLKNLNPKKIPISLYIHLPWCEKKCPYCDFNVDIHKQNGDEENLLKAILEDLERSEKYISNRKFSSVYFGGGTPSLVSSKIIEQITKVLSNKKLLNDNCEINFELNPKEVMNDYLNELMNAGINRISIGIQSFDQNVLSDLERNHSSMDALKAVEIISSLNSINTTIDLIYGVMDQTLESVIKDINTFCSFDLGHLSMYQLTIEPNTIFYKRNIITPPDNSIELMEIEAKKILKRNKFYQYEVSSWAKNGKESKHNMNYWGYGDYLGLGPGAHSKITTNKSITRMIKLKRVKSYIDNPCKTKNTEITKQNYDLDLAMNLLRIKEGLTFDEINKRNIYLSKTFLSKLEKGVEENLLEKGGIKASDMGYKFLNDTVNIFS